jgi:hypothetical protein
VGKSDCIKKPGKMWIVISAVVMALTIVVAGILFTGKGQTVEFKVLSEQDYPQEICSDVIPEYRSLERALACVVEEKVYVIVTRGEKPASGYKVDIDKMKLEDDGNKSVLVVYAVFRDPAKNDSMSQVLTYPVKVAETQLKKLPDEIELRVQYEE